MTLTPAQREQCAKQLLASAPKVGRLTAFLGLDGFVDDILHVVDKRQDAENYTRLPMMNQWGERINAAAGRSTNIELVSKMMKLGGNGPIMANALASFGCKVSYLGVLGYPKIHPVFDEFTKRAEVVSIAEPGYTYAVEFEDGKVMLGKHQALKDMNWKNILARYGEKKFAQKFATADFVGFVNWTMLPYMSQIWGAIQKNLSPKLKGPRRRLFVDLADPEKRLPKDILKALKLIVKFGQHFDVILGLNEKEAHEIGKTLGIDWEASTPEALAELGQAIHKHVQVETLVIHPVAFALTVSKDGVAMVPGPLAEKPKITTGAGDHFNAGFCLGKLLGLDNLNSLLVGVSTSGAYVRTAKSPTVRDVAALLRKTSVKYG